MWDDKWTGKTIGAALDEAAERYGDKVATVFQNGEVTYNQLKQTADLVARGFLSLGIGKATKLPSGWPATRSGHTCILHWPALGRSCCRLTPVTGLKKSNMCSTNPRRRFLF